jgi:hypothetical protein
MATRRPKVNEVSRVSASLRLLSAECSETQFQSAVKFWENEFKKSVVEANRGR